jgi:hypothetical protein
VVGRHVTVVLPGEKKILTLCEVEVYGTSVLGMWNPRILNLPFSNVPQKCVKTTENLTVHYPLCMQQQSTLGLYLCYMS